MAVPLTLSRCQQVHADAAWLKHAKALSITWCTAIASKVLATASLTPSRERMERQLPRLQDAAPISGRVGHPEARLRVPTRTGIRTSRTTRAARKIAPLCTIQTGHGGRGTALAGEAMLCANGAAIEAVRSTGASGLRYPTAATVRRLATGLPAPPPLLRGPTASPLELRRTWPWC